MVFKIQYFFPSTQIIVCQGDKGCGSGRCWAKAIGTESPWPWWAVEIDSLGGLLEWYGMNIWWTDKCASWQVWKEERKEGRNTHSDQTSCVLCLKDAQVSENLNADDNKLGEKISSLIWSCHRKNGLSVRRPATKNDGLVLEIGGTLEGWRRRGPGCMRTTDCGMAPHQEETRRIKFHSQDFLPIMLYCVSEMCSEAGHLSVEDVFVEFLDTDSQVSVWSDCNCVCSLFITRGFLHEELS